MIIDCYQSYYFINSDRGDDLLYMKHEIEEIRKTVQHPKANNVQNTIKIQ